MTLEKEEVTQQSIIMTRNMVDARNKKYTMWYETKLTKEFPASVETAGGPRPDVWTRFDIQEDARVNTFWYTGRYTENSGQDRAKVSKEWGNSTQ
jgi:hypothetical protein